MNHLTLLGNICRDPELSVTPNGIEKCNFSVACNRRVANKDGQRETDYFNCTAWRNTAVFISNYFHKGDKIALEGSMQMRKYKDKEGNDRTAYDVQIDNAEFCTAKGSGSHPQPEQPSDPADDGSVPPWMQ